MFVKTGRRIRVSILRLILREEDGLVLRPYGYEGVICVRFLSILLLRVYYNYTCMYTHTHIRTYTYIHVHVGESREESRVCYRFKELLRNKRIESKCGMFYWGRVWFLRIYNNSLIVEQ